MNSLAFENKKEVKKSITRKKLELRDFSDDDQCEQ